VAPRSAARPAHLVPLLATDCPAARSSGLANLLPDQPAHRTPMASRTAAAQRGSTEERTRRVSEPSGPGRSSPAGRWDLGRRLAARPSAQLASLASAAAGFPAGAAQATASAPAALPVAGVLPAVGVSTVPAGPQKAGDWAKVQASRGRTVRPTTVSRQAEAAARLSLVRPAAPALRVAPARREVPAQRPSQAVGRASLRVVPAVPVVGAAGAGARARHRRVEVAECPGAPLPERLHRCPSCLCLIRRIRIRQPCLTPPWSQANVGRIPAPTLRDPDI